MKPSALIDKYREETGNRSWRKTAESIGISVQAILKARETERLDDSTIIEICKQLQISPDETIFFCHAQKAKTKDEKRFWENFIRASAAGITALALLPINAVNDGISALQCILCKKRETLI